MKILKDLMSLVTVATLASGCAGVLPQKSPSERLGTIPSMVSYQDGYAMHRGTEMQLRVIAGIYAGTLNVERDGNTIKAEGSYSRFLHPEAMEYALQRADTDGDKLITREEANTLHRKVIGTQ